MPELQLCLRSSPALAGCITHPEARSLLFVIIITGMNCICWFRIARGFIARSAVISHVASLISRIGLRAGGLCLCNLARNTLSSGEPAIAVSN